MQHRPALDVAQHRPHQAVWFTCPAATARTGAVHQSRVGMGPCLSCALPLTHSAVAVCDYQQHFLAQAVARGTTHRRLWPSPLLPLERCVRDPGYPSAPSHSLSSSSHTLSSLRQGQAEAAVRGEGQLPSPQARQHAGGQATPCIMPAPSCNKAKSTHCACM